MDKFNDDILKDFNIKLTETQINQFKKYYELLIKWNEKINLTAIVEEEEVYYKHFYDSLILSKTINLNNINSICDVGAGAGFPSIPIKILYPNLEITIVDSLNKRIIFLNNLVKELNLNNVFPINERAEVYAKNNKKFDIVTARAVARLNILSELCIPMVKKDGSFIALKSTKLEEEIIEANNGISILGGKKDNVITYNLPYEYGERKLLKITKIKDTPFKYPRNYGQIKNKPL